MDKIFVALILLSCGLFLPLPLFFPGYLFACVIVMLFYRAAFWRSISKFLSIWMLFFLIVGMGRFAAGVDLLILVKDGSFGLGLAVSISCSLLLIVSDSPDSILSNLDGIKVPRSVSYSILSLLRLLPQIKNIGKRQVELLKLKTDINDGLSSRILAYPRILGPLFTILLTQQYVHSRSLAERGFYSPASASQNTRKKKTNTTFIFVVVTLMLNIAIWNLIWDWYPW